MKIKLKFTGFFCKIDVGWPKINHIKHGDVYQDFDTEDYYYFVAGKFHRLSDRDRSNGYVVGVMDNGNQEKK